MEAWYTVDASGGTTSAGTAIQGTIGSQTSQGESVGNFLVSVTSGSVTWTPSKVCLSDAEGKTYIDTNGATAGGKVEATGTVNTTGKFGMTVTYQGTALQDDTAIKAAWDITKANYTFKVTITDSSSSLQGYIANSGVKLAAAGGNASTSALSTLDVAIAAGVLDGNFLNGELIIPEAGSFVAALKGLDDVVQADSDPYQITLTPVVTAIA